jgi:integrase
VPDRFRGPRTTAPRLTEGSCRPRLAGGIAPSSRPASRRRPRPTAAPILQTLAVLEDVPTFLDILRTDTELRRLDIGDLFAFMVLTGCRIGEALALAWSRADLEHVTVTFDSTVVRVRGAGLALQEQGKTISSTRTISLPEEASRSSGAVIRPRSSSFRR